MSDRLIHAPGPEYVPAAGSEFGAPEPEIIEREGRTVTAWFISDPPRHPVQALIDAIRQTGNDAALGIVAGPSGEVAVSIAAYRDVLLETTPEPVRVNRETLALFGRCALRAAADPTLWEENK